MPWVYAHQIFCKKSFYIRRVPPAGHRSPHQRAVDHLLPPRCEAASSNALWRAISSAALIAFASASASKAATCASASLAYALHVSPPASAAAVWRSLAFRSAGARFSSFDAAAFVVGAGGVAGAPKPLPCGLASFSLALPLAFFRACPMLHVDFLGIIVMIVARGAIPLAGDMSGNCSAVAAWRLAWRSRHGSRIILWTDIVDLDAPSSFNLKLNLPHRSW